MAVWCKLWEEGTILRLLGVFSAAEKRLLLKPAIDSCIPEDAEGSNHRTLLILGSHWLRHILRMWLC